MTQATSLPSVSEKPAKRGRPSKYTPETANEVCARLANGEMLRAICRDGHMPHEATVRTWVVNDVDGISTRYTQARETGWDVMAEQCVEISDGAEAENAAVNKARLRVDTRKWLLSKMFPKRYGDRIEAHHTGEVRTRASENEGVLARSVLRLLSLAETVDGGELESQPIDNTGD